MILRKLVILRGNISKHRRDLYKLADKYGRTDPQVLQISEKLDKEIMKWQKIIKYFR